MLRIGIRNVPRMSCGRSTVKVIGGSSMTRTVWTLAWLLLLVSANPRADDCRPADPHLRSDEPALVAAIASAADRSPTFHRLVERLNRSDVVVYLTFDGRPAWDLAGRTTFVSAAGGRRSLRIAILRC
jgi:hypothetical protein